MLAYPNLLKTFSNLIKIRLNFISPQPYNQTIVLNRLKLLEIHSWARSDHLAILECPMIERLYSTFGQLPFGYEPAYDFIQRFPSLTVLGTEFRSLFPQVLHQDVLTIHSTVRKLVLKGDNGQVSFKRIADLQKIIDSMPNVTELSLWRLIFFKELPTSPSELSEMSTQTKQTSLSRIRSLNLYDIDYMVSEPIPEYIPSSGLLNGIAEEMCDLTSVSVEDPRRVDFFWPPDHNVVLTNQTCTSGWLINTILCASVDENSCIPCFWKSLRSIKMAEISLTLQNLGHLLNALKLRSYGVEKIEWCKLTLIVCTLEKMHCDYSLCQLGRGKRLDIPSFTDYTHAEVKILMSQLSDAWDGLTKIDVD